MEMRNAIYVQLKALIPKGLFAKFSLAMARGRNFLKLLMSVVFDTSAAARIVKMGRLPTISINGSAFMRWRENKHTRKSIGSEKIEYTMLGQVDKFF